MCVCARARVRTCVHRSQTQMPAGTAGVPGVGQPLSISRLLCPLSPDCSKKAALGLGVNKEGWGQDCSSRDSSYWVKEASEMPGKPGPFTGENSCMYSATRQASPLPRAEPSPALHAALPEGSGGSSHDGTPQAAKSPRQRAPTTQGHRWSKGPGQRLAGVQCSGRGTE